MQRLGASDEFADAILTLLRADGWRVDEYRAFGGGHCLVGSKKGAMRLRVFGDTRSQVALAALAASTPEAEAA